MEYGYFTSGSSIYTKPVKGSRKVALWFEDGEEVWYCGLTKNITLAKMVKENDIWVVAFPTKSPSEDKRQRLSTTLYRERIRPVERVSQIVECFDVATEMVIFGGGRACPNYVSKVWSQVPP